MLKDEIEQVLKVMAKVLSDIAGIDSFGQYSVTIEASVRKLKMELDIDLELLLSLSFEELSDYIEISNLSENIIINLSEIFNEMGKAIVNYNSDKAKLYYNKSYELLNVLDNKSKMYSIDRKNKISELNNKIESL